MVMVASRPISGTVFDKRVYTIEHDPTGGTLQILVDGEVALSHTVEQRPRDFRFVALRALGPAEFSNLAMTSLEPDHRVGEDSDE